MTISMVVLFGIALIVCIAKDGLGKFHAFVAVMFGLYLGSTGVGPTLKAGTESFLGWLGQIQF